MAPKKAMKGILKVKKGLGKSKVRKGLGKPKAKAKTKAQAKAKAKRDLSKANLEKLGHMSLKDKVTKACEEGDSLEESAELLKKSLTKDEHSQIWGKHQTALKNASDLEKSEYEKKGKKEKGLAAAMWLLIKDGKKYMHCRRDVHAKESLKKGDKWEPWKQMLEKFDEQELNQHLASGRVIWRDDPVTWGVFQYKDTQDWSRELHVGRGKTWQEGQEYEPEKEDLEKFNELYNQDAMGLSLEDISDGLGKGKGKGLGKKGLGKGHGKGKGKGKKGLGKGDDKLAICDGSVDDKEPSEEEDLPTEEEALEMALKKAKKARDAVCSARADLEDALEKASPHLSRKGKAGAAGLDVELGKVHGLLKGVLQGKKKGQTSKSVQKVLEESAKVIKAAKDECKELMQIGNKAQSVASKRSRT